MRGLLAQTEMGESLSSDLVSILALGDVDPLGRSGLSADAAIRRMHEFGTCFCAGHATDAHGDFKDITEQDWPDGDLNPTVEGMELNQEMPENQLPSRRLMRKTPPSEVDAKHPDPRNEHVV